MRSIERRFQIETDKGELLSSIVIFTRTVAGQRFTREVIAKWFPKLVDKGDYNSRDKQALLDYLEKVSNS